ncbi:hypothetical protein [Streptomyces sp. NPDC019890]|uniref:hypothetical protein n=1 Tax=Streptomyces sp. NPDC019890 TaxID=3365064 RepID=UPI00384F4F57
MEFKPLSRLRRFARRMAHELRRLGQWAAARRRAALSLFLRGLCQGLGVSTVGLVVFLVERSV